MHSDAASVKSSIRKYMMVGAALLVFTAITVAANQVHLAVPIAVTVALIIATMKGSMVAAVFMHLSHEKKWIYGALLLTVVLFVVLMCLPVFTTLDNLFWTVGFAVPAWSAYEVVTMWLYANGYIPYVSIAEHPVYFVVLMCLPVFTTMDNIGTPIHRPPAADPSGH